MATILIADDHPANREFLTTLLGYGGHRLLEAKDGSEALDAVRSARPDLVIADIVMPTMDGYEFVRRLRLDPTIAHTPVIFYTAHYLEREARNLADACGVLHVITKPSDPEVILQTVAAALGAAPPATLPPDLGDAFDREHVRVMTDKLQVTAAESEALNARLSALLALNQRLASERDPRRLLETLCHAARELLGARYAAVGVRGDNGHALRDFVVSGMGVEATQNLRPPLPGAGALAGLMAGRRAIRLAGPIENPLDVGLPRGWPAVGSLLGVPIVSPTNLYGWLCLTDKLGADEFTDEDERLAGILAAQAGRIYENGSLYAELQHRAEDLEYEIDERRRADASLQQHAQRLETLHAIDQTILTGGSPSAIAASVLEHVRQVLPCDRASVILFEYDRQEAQIIATQVEPHEAIRPSASRAPLNPAFLDQLRRAPVHIIDDITAQPLPQFAVRAAEGLRTLLSVPLVARGELIGALNLWHKTRATCQPLHLALAQEVAAPLSIGLAQARLLEQVRQNAADLEQRVRERTVQLEAANDELEAFSFSVSHDLQAPLRHLQAFAQILMEEHAQQLDEAGRSHVGRLQTAAQRMQALIADLLSLSRVARLDLHRESVDLSALVAELADELREVHPFRVLEVEVASGLVARGDRRLLRVALGNLLDNAWKYTSRHERARIEFGVVEREGRREYFVRDDGAGFEMEHVGRLFGAFHRLHSATEFEGTGVGLATVQRIIHRHGGRIWAEGAVEQGATFYFTLDESSS